MALYYSQRGSQHLLSRMSRPIVWQRSMRAIIFPLPGLSRRLPPQGLCYSSSKLCSQMVTKGHIILISNLDSLVWQCPMSAIVSPPRPRVVVSSSPPGHHFSLSKLCSQIVIREHIILTFNLDSPRNSDDPSLSHRVDNQGQRIDKQKKRTVKCQYMSWRGNFKSRYLSWRLNFKKPSTTLRRGLRGSWRIGFFGSHSLWVYQLLSSAYSIANSLF